MNRCSPSLFAELKGFLASCQSGEVESCLLIGAKLLRALCFSFILIVAWTVALVLL